MPDTWAGMALSRGAAGPTGSLQQAADFSQNVHGSYRTAQGAKARTAAGTGALRPYSGVQQGTGNSQICLSVGGGYPRVYSPLSPATVPGSGSPEGRMRGVYSSGSPTLCGADQPLSLCVSRREHLSAIGNQASRANRKDPFQCPSNNVCASHRWKLAGRPCKLLTCPSPPRPVRLVTVQGCEQPGVSRSLPDTPLSQGHGVSTD